MCMAHSANKKLVEFMCVFFLLCFKLYIFYYIVVNLYN